MRRLLSVVVLVLLTGSTVPAAQALPGPLIVVGGGGTTPAIVAKALALAGGHEARVAVLPQASELPETGPDSAKMWMEAGAKGLGLWPQVIVDQHFLKRQRGNRLISAVLDHPTLVGVGIDEQTAVIVRGSSFEVVGASAVVVVDPRQASKEPAIQGKPVAATDLRLSVLREGMTYRFK